MVAMWKWWGFQILHVFHKQVSFFVHIPTLALRGYRVPPIPIGKVNSWVTVKHGWTAGHKQKKLEVIKPIIKVGNSPLEFVDELNPYKNKSQCLRTEIPFEEMVDSDFQGISGQFLIFHQPGFPWNKAICAGGFPCYPTICPGICIYRSPQSPVPGPRENPPTPLATCLATSRKVSTGSSYNCSANSFWNDATNG